MNAHQRIYKKFKLLVLSWLFFTMWPSHTVSINYKFIQSGLNIELGGGVLPLFSIQDELIEPQLSSKKIIPSLVTANVRSHDLLEKKLLPEGQQVVQAEERVPGYEEPLQIRIIDLESTNRVVKLRGMTIRKDSAGMKNLMKQKFSQPKRNRLNKIMVMNEINKDYSVQKWEEKIAQFEQKKDKRDFLNSLNPRLKVRAEKIPNLESLLEEGYNLKHQKSQFIKEAFVSEFYTHTSEKKNKIAKKVKRRPTGNKSKTNNNLHTKSEPMFEVSSIDGLEKNESMNQQRIIKGSLQMKEGLAYLGAPQSLEIYRTIAGQKFERANLDISTGQYEILVDYPERGALVAQLTSGDGTTLAREERKILNHREINFSLEPKFDGWKSKVNNIDTYDALKAGVANASVKLSNKLEFKSKKSGLISAENILSSSTLDLKVSRPRFWPTHLSTMGGSYEIPLFPKSYIDVFLQTLNRRKASQLEGVLFGEVQRNQTRMLGVSVRSLNQDKADIVYFNELGIPDKRLKATTSSGKFAFLNLEKGHHIIESQLFGQSLSTHRVWVDKNQITYLPIRFTKPKKKETFVFDAITGEPEEVKISMLGSSNELSSGSDYFYTYVIDNNPWGFFKVSPKWKQYDEAIYLVNQSKSYMNFPLLSRDWFHAKMSALKVSHEPGTSYVVGFVQDAHFELVNTPRMVYLDNQGGVLPTKAPSQLRKGFLIWGAKEGIEEVELRYLNLSKTEFIKIPVDERMISVIVK